jgi:hypothetical protein
MTKFYRHDKRSAWGLGRLVAEDGRGLRIVFEDGKERTLMTDAPGLVAVEPSDAEKSKLPAMRQPPADQRGALRKLRPSTLVKSFRLAIRDALTTVKDSGGYPDDTLVELQKGLSRITADHARFLGSSTEVVRAAGAEGARKLHDEHGVIAIFEELAARLDDVEIQPWPYTRAHVDPVEAAEHVRELAPYVQRAADLADAELEELAGLLQLPDLRPARD